MSGPATPRPGLRGVAPYHSPQLDAVARLNTNECPYPLPEAFVEALTERVRAISLNRYPDGQMTELRTALGASVGLPVERTWAANGSNEIITQLLLAYGGPDRRAVVFEPTYLLHSRLAWLTRTEVVAFRLDPPWRLTSRDVAAAVDARPDVVFVCSPNNPTGNSHPTEVVAALAAETDALVVVDEAYIEFGGATSLPLIAAHPNVVVVRTLSKAFALAGARVGYALAEPAVIGDLERVRLPYHLSALSQAAGIVALEHAPAADSILGRVRDQRDRIVRELGAMADVSVHPSDANFVLFDPGRPAAGVWGELLERGVLVRDLSAVVPNALRVTAGTEHEVDLFLKSLEEVLSG